MWLDGKDIVRKVPYIMSSYVICGFVLWILEICYGVGFIQTCRIAAGTLHWNHSAKTDTC